MTDNKSFLFFTKSFYLTIILTIYKLLPLLPLTGYIIDPQTSLAKTVADKMNLGIDVPVIFPVTAHYTKYLDDVVSAVGPRAGTSSNDSSLVEKVFKMTQKLPMHKGLWTDVHDFPFHHPNMVCNKNINLYLNVLLVKFIFILNSYLYSIYLLLSFYTLRSQHCKIKSSYIHCQHLATFLSVHF